jgi:hypothetical protein
MSKIKAVFINTENQTVSNIEIEASLSAYYQKLNVQLISNAGYQANGDWLMVDDEGLFTSSPEFFSIAGNVHSRLAGNALIVGDDGNGGDCDAKTRAEDLVVTFYAAKIETPANNDGIVTAACGCRFDWNDKFYESRCDAHLAEESGRMMEMLGSLARQEREREEAEIEMLFGERETGWALVDR